MTKQEPLVWGIEGDDLPEIITLKSGGKLDPRKDHWKFVDGFQAVYINFNRLPSQVEPLKNNLKRVLINVLENNAPAYAVNLFYRFNRMAEVVAEGSEGPI